MHDNKEHHPSEADITKFEAPLVSILIPSFNHEKYIVDCLESVKSSDYENLELIILDDGSSDKTFELADQWLHVNQERFVRASCSRQSNSGICKTLNSLVSSSSGEYISALASDDQLLPQGISYQVSCALKTNAGLVLSDCELIDENGSLIALSAFEYFGKNAIRLKNKSFLHLDILLNWNLPYPHHFIKRALFDSLGPYNANYLIEDYDFCLKALFNSNLELCQHSSWRYRIRLSDRVTPGLDKCEILRNVRAIQESHLHHAKGLENLTLKAVIYQEEVTKKPFNVKVRFAWFVYKVMRLFLKTTYRLS